jgi:hypothetical protein
VSTHLVRSEAGGRGAGAGAALRRRGLTLVELVLALGLFALLAVLLVRLIDTTLTLWERTEAQRERLERETVLWEWLQRDLEFLAGGEQGDLLCDYEVFDVDGDGVAGRPLPRLRLVRRTTLEDLQRLGLRVPVDETGESARPPGGATPLIEVLWCQLPATSDPRGPARGDGVLYRGERLVGDTGTASFFAPGALRQDGRPLVGAVQPISGGVLWWECLFASQTTSLLDGWQAGVGLADAGRSFDARGAGRPLEERHPWNALADGGPEYRGDPLFPRRIRIELELERPDDLRRRPLLAADCAADANELELTHVRGLPPPGSPLLLGEEWVQLQSVAGARLAVLRGLRGTRPVAHRRGELLHFGDRLVREVLVPQHGEDWGL